MSGVSSGPHQVPRHGGQSQMSYPPGCHLVPHIALVAVHIHQPCVARDLEVGGAKVGRGRRSGQVTLSFNINMHITHM